MVSLFPEDTWQSRPNGLRKDLVQLLADLKPGFIRFPGGCIVEGRLLDGRYQWKTTIGELAERKAASSIAGTTNSAHRAAPDYYQSFGLGLLRILPACRGHRRRAAADPQLRHGVPVQFGRAACRSTSSIPYVQDALDLIEFANGPVDEPTGASCARRWGIPAPFNLKFIGVGNEQWGPQYIERYELFAKVLKKKHPEIALVSSAGPFSAGKEFDYLWGRAARAEGGHRRRALLHAAELVPDEHQPLRQLSAHRPEGLRRRIRGADVGVAKPDNRNTWEAALAEAAFMTGLERNADIVRCRRTRRSSRTSTPGSGRRT